ncbi:TetR/AcrR family transcriptional regulator [Promicromonospora kroppenstedtii]|uniref:TetR/AcrR family transcriptional regulator n=1 Tax=Promicromonospora kroppenstedtii TaxID=440482 RepID=UPI000563C45A|nr:TetR/AcrR family transcriptional regulator [Promicromonospora kroppenstedtii]
MTMRTTARGAATRQRLVSGAALLMREQGAAVTNLDQVLRATSTSKSQLFHYFPDGRAGLLVAVTSYEVEQVIEAQRPHLDDLSTAKSWREWRGGVLRHYVELGERCPMGSLTSELGTSSPEARNIVNGLYDRWEGALMAGVQAMIVNGAVRPDLPVRDTARSILTAVQGGVVMLRATGRLSYLETTLDTTLEPLLGTPRAAA